MAPPKRKRGADAPTATAAETTDAKVDWDDLKYNSGFGSQFESEALEGALPKGQNAPQRCAYGLYAEQVNGTAFTVPRVNNQKCWVYRIRPSVAHAAYHAYDHAYFHSDFGKAKFDPSQFRWGCAPIPDEAQDFVDGLRTFGGAGEAGSTGIAIHMFMCNKSMVNRAFYNADGDMLIVAQQGDLRIRTEFGLMKVSPHEICVIQRGIRFQVMVDGPTRGYVCEVFGRHFVIPDLGPIGANGLANARDFKYPVAAFEDRDCDFTLIAKYGGSTWACHMDHSPFDVVAFHGNYVPYKYNLDNFNTMNSVSFDHPDPSIYTVLTCPSESPGTAICDFVIFPPRWMVMDRSFRPPYYHRNIMTEYMGMVYGKYDAKVGFVPGGASLHSAMTPHGPDAPTFSKASNADLKPEYFDGGLAFMFETSLTLKLTPWALNAPHRDTDYSNCWKNLPKLFDGVTKDVPVPVITDKMIQTTPAAGAAAGAADGNGTAAAGKAR